MFRSCLELGRTVYPKTRQQRCWMHKVMNVLQMPEVGPGEGETGEARSDRRW